MPKQNLNSKLQQLKAKADWVKPAIFRAGNSSDLVRLEKLVSSGHVLQTFDRVDLAIKDLFDIAYPSEKDLAHKPHWEMFKQKYGSSYGIWIYYPWSASLVRFPTKSDLHKLRTSRNRNLVTTGEQATLYQATILVCGMSVGSNAVEALVSQGIGGRLILADMDIIEPSNLNRIRAGYHQVGVHKVDHVAKLVSEIDPYIKQVHYKKGMNLSVLDKVINKSRPTIIIDEMDDVRMKILIRKRAQKERIAVISAADDGDDTLLDIERYDLKAHLPLYHGKIPAKVIKHLIETPDIPRAQLGGLIGKYFVGYENVPLRMFQSLAEVGKSIPSWPQLGGAAAQSGIALAYAAKKIILRQPLKSGRFVIGPDHALNPLLQTANYKRALAKITRSLP